MKVIRITGFLLFLVVSTNFSSLGSDIQFIENKGQWDKNILYKAGIQNGVLLITHGGLEYLFYDAEKLNAFSHGNHSTDQAHSRSKDPDYWDSNMLNLHGISLDFLYPSPELTLHAEDEQEVYYNFFLGDDMTKWASKVKVFKEILYNNIYPGIHMRLYGSDTHLKYDIIVEPGADCQNIKFRYSGAEDIRIIENSLYTKTSLNTIIENAPISYQINSNDTIFVPSSYKIENNVVSFEFPEGYDPLQPLIIDPLLVFSSYSGSSYDNWGNTATYDNRGNVYSGGTVRMAYGFNFPVTPGAFQEELGGLWDIGILKFDSTGNRLLYGSYLGGSGTETPFSLIVNHNDELIIYGITGSMDYPVTDNAYSKVFLGGDSVGNALGNYNSGNLGISYREGSDFFIARISSDGTQLLSSTYLGGSNNDGINNAPGFPLSRNYGDEFRGEVNIDSENNIYIAGNTSSIDFPIVNGFQVDYGGGTQDGIIAKLAPDLSDVLWSTYIGGSLADAAYGIIISKDTLSFITGGTMSNDFPVTSNALNIDFGGDVDGFISSLSSDGTSLISSTFLGTNNYDQSYFIDFDQDENVYVLGQTKGIYPVSTNVYINPASGQFIHKLSPDLSTSIFSTVVGSGSGIPDISPTAFLINECGNIFLSGWGGQINNPTYQGVAKYNGGNTFDLPVTSDAFQTSTDGSEFYLMVLSANAEKLLYGTYLGALNSGPGEHVDGGTSRFDKRGIVYHAICACRDASQFPTTPGVWSNINSGLPNGCNNGVFKFDLSALKADFTTDSYEFDNPGVTLGCEPFEVVFLNRSIGGKEYEWDFGDGSDLSYQEDSLFHTYPKYGIYEVTLKAFDENTCLKIDIARKELDVKEPQFRMPNDREICQYDGTLLEASGAVSYRWFPSYGLNNSHIANPLASPDTTTMYFLLMKDQYLCSYIDSVLVEVIPDISSDFYVNKIYDCYSHPKVELLNTSTNSNLHNWDFGDGNFSEEDSTIHIYEEPGNYTIRLEASNEGSCGKISEQTITLSDIYVPNVITPNNDGKNDSFEIITDAQIDLIILNRWGKTIYKDRDYQNNWKAKNLPGGTYYYEIKLEEDAACNGWLQVFK